MYKLPPKRPPVPPRNSHGSSPGPVIHRKPSFPSSDEKSPPVPSLPPKKMIPSHKRPSLPPTPYNHSSGRPPHGGFGDKRPSLPPGPIGGNQPGHRRNQSEQVVGSGGGHIGDAEQLAQMGVIKSDVRRTPFFNDLIIFESCLLIGVREVDERAEDTSSSWKYPSCHCHLRPTRTSRPSHARI